MATIREAIEVARRRLAEAGVDSPRLDADLLFGHVLGLDRGGLLVHGDHPLDGPGGAAIEQLIARRAAREPVSHLIGRREFWGLDFAVSPATLDPRPDTETLVESVLRLLAGRRGEPLAVLDLGTGTGCILAALLTECPAARGIGIDVTAAAVVLARRNLAALDLDGRAEVHQGDWCQGLRGLFDVVVSNPPYIPDGEIATLAPDVCHYEPVIALAGGGDGLTCYRRIFTEVPPLLAPGGLLAVEIGSTQAVAVGGFAAAAGLVDIGGADDLGGRPRVVWGYKKGRVDGH